MTGGSSSTIRLGAVHVLPDARQRHASRYKRGHAEEDDAAAYAFEDVSGSVG
jgi:hypothetical protein